jgi:hypothetical protein
MFPLKISNPMLAFLYKTLSVEKWLIGALFLVVSCHEPEIGIEIVDPNIPVEECFSGSNGSTGGRISGDYIVVYKKKPALPATEGRMMEVSESLLARNGIYTNVKATFSGFQSGFVCKLSAKQVASLQKDNDIEFVEPDRMVAVSVCLRVIDSATVAWGTKHLGFGDGTGKTAWIIDTGIDLHHSDLNVDTIRSRSFLEGEVNAQDRSGHGTHVAGIIGAKNNDFGTLGIASGATLVALKVLDQLGAGRVSTVVKALGYINQNAKVGDVVNMSLVSDTISLSLDNEVTGLANKGILFAIASGNGGKSASGISPVRIKHPNVFKVASMDSTKIWASYSNFGVGIVDVAAPGEWINSTAINNQYAIMAGTSVAAPHMAGLLLLDGRNFSKKGVVLFAPENEPYPIPHKK